MNYKYLKEMAGDEPILAGQNDKGEHVIVEQYKDRFVVTTCQSNGWLRINVFHKDGTYEEYYEK